jgi:hypothetical protein
MAHGAGFGQLAGKIGGAAPLRFCGNKRNSGRNSDGAWRGTRAGAARIGRRSHRRSTCCEKPLASASR